MSRHPVRFSRRDQQHDERAGHTAAASSRGRRRHPQHLHVAVALDELAGRIGARSFAADRSGYDELIDWASSLGREVVFGVEGTGSYGAGLASVIRRRQIGVLEVLRTDRRDRRLRGKSDTIDAENAARAVLNGQASAVWGVYLSPDSGRMGQ